MVNVELVATLIPRSLRPKPAWFAKILRTTLRALQLPGSWELSIAFVDHKTMRRLNRTYRDCDKVTDILSFTGVGGPSSLGELILAWPYVEKQAKENDTPFLSELAHLLIHGILHLRGYDHEHKRDAKVMIPLEHKILTAFLRNS